MSPVLVKVIRSWLPLAVAITGMCGLVYVAVQQSYRQSLNDPQVQMAEDAAQYLLNDYSPAAVVPRGAHIDISESLAPWIAVYDENGRPLESSGVLNGVPLQPPSGVFDVARTGHGKDTSIDGQNRVSWQPMPEVRSAIVVQHFAGAHSGFVVVGRSMREVEKREGDLTTVVGLAWLALLVATFAMKRLVKWPSSRDTI